MTHNPYSDFDPLFIELMKKADLSCLHPTSSNKLIAYVLNRAILDIRVGHTAYWKKRVPQAPEKALSWMSSTVNSNRPFSLKWVCDVLGLCPQYVLEESRALYHEALKRYRSSCD